MKGSESSAVVWKIIKEYFTIVSRSQHSNRPHRLCLVLNTLFPVLTAFAFLHQCCLPPILTAFCICHVVVVPGVGVRVLSSSCGIIIIGDIVVVGHTVVIGQHRRHHGHTAVIGRIILSVFAAGIWVRVILVG